MKAPTTRKRKDRLNNRAASRQNTSLSLFQISAVKHYQGTAIISRDSFIREKKATLQASIGKGTVLRAIVGKHPAKYLSKKCFCYADISGGELNIVYLFMVTHRCCPAGHG